MAKMSAISFNFSMAYSPSQRWFELREEQSSLATQFDWPGKSDYSLTPSVLYLMRKRRGLKPSVFRMPLFPRRTLSRYPSQKRSEFNESYCAQNQYCLQDEHNRAVQPADERCDRMRAGTCLPQKHVVSPTNAGCCSLMQPVQSCLIRLLVSGR